MTAPQFNKVASGVCADRPALVAFVDGRPRFWRWVLKPGFRHCFVALDDGDVWIMIDPLGNGLEIVRVPKEGMADPAAFWRGLGARVIETTARPGGAGALPPGPFTCVETVKRVLGLHAAFVLTPRQLYRALKKNQKNMKKVLAPKKE